MSSGHFHFTHSINFSLRLKFSLFGFGTAHESDAQVNAGQLLKRIYEIFARVK